jgi:hypothetical protein
MKANVRSHAVWSVIEGDPPGDWNNWVDRHPRGLVFHHGAWATAAAVEGWRSFWVIGRDDGGLAGGVLTILRRVPGLGWAADAPGGMLLRPNLADLAGQVEAVLHCWSGEARRRGVVIAEWHDRTPTESGEGAAIMEALPRGGFQPAGTTLGTFMQRVDQSDEILLSGFSQLTRRNIRKAVKAGVVTRICEDPGALKEFYHHYNTMADRKGLETVGRAFIERGLEAPRRDGAVAVFGSFASGEALNMAVIATTGMPRYLFGASTEFSRREDQPPGGPILHYDIMRWIRNRSGCWYDWGGSPGPSPDPSHPNYGVWRFKASFGGSYEYHVGHWTRVYRPWRHAVWRHVMVPAARQLARWRGDS